MSKKSLSAAGATPAALPAGLRRHPRGIVTASYWQIGRRIVEAEQQGEWRAGNGERLIERLFEQGGKGHCRHGWGNRSCSKKV